MNRWNFLEENKGLYPESHPATGKYKTGPVMDRPVKMEIIERRKILIIQPDKLKGAFSEIITGRRTVIKMKTHHLRGASS